MDCFAEGTQIQMADGSIRAIENIRIGDLIRSVDHSACRVINIWTGSEQSMLLIKFSGGEICVTDSHPFQTKNGPRSAKQILAGDQLLSDNGSCVVVSIEQKDNECRVYNLESDCCCNGFWLIANGLIAGDFQMMNQQQRD